VPPPACGKVLTQQREAGQHRDQLTRQLVEKGAFIQVHFEILQSRMSSALSVQKV
jgi:hypothetical protein